MIRHVGLQEDAARPLRPAGPAGDLVQQLIGPLCCPEVAAGKPQIGVDDPHQGQKREVMPLGDELRADHQVDLVLLDPRSEEHTSELQSLMRISYAVFFLKKKKTT